MHIYPMSKKTKNEAAIERRRERDSERDDILNEKKPRGRPRKEAVDEESGHSRSITEEARDGVISVTLFVLAIYLILAAFKTGGPAGDTIYSIGKNTFGIGYFALPIALCFLSVSFITSKERRATWLQVVGACALIASTLGIVTLISDPIYGGYVGKYFSYPFVSLFNSYAGGLFLVAIAISSIYIMFNTRLKKSHVEKVVGMFKRGQEEDGDSRTKITGLSDSDYEDAEAESLQNAVNENEGDQNAEDRARGLSQEDIDAIEKGKAELRKNNPNQQQGNAKEIEQAETTTRGGFHPLIHMLGKPFNPPPLSILEVDKGKPGVGDIKANANIIKRTLQNFGINVEMDEISIGPSITRYALKPAEGVKLSRIIGLQNNLALALAAHPIRIEAPIPGKSLVGIEIPNSIKTTVGLGTLLADNKFKTAPEPLLIALGKDTSGKAHFGNIAKMPHVLIAGTTGSGKSVSIHTIITSLLYRNSPENLRFIMIDPKRVELTQYNGIPHLLTPVITDAKKAILSLKWAAKEMDRRYNILEAAKVRDISSYHQNILSPALKKAAERKERGELSEEDAEKIPETMPYIVIMIDELADIMQTYPRELEASIVRLAQMSRAVGIHLLLATQRPSVNVITGLIKANVPSRIAFQVASQIDSRTILDAAGADKLLGAGDMLCLTNEMSSPIRLQGAYISESEIKRVVKYLVDNYQQLPSEIAITGAGGKEMAGIPNDAIFNSSKMSPGSNSAGMSMAGGGPGGISALDSDLGGSLKDDEPDDDLYEDAKETVIRAGKASTSYIQRKLSIGYARAARLMDILEERGVIGPANGAKPRDVLGNDDGGTSQNDDMDSLNQ